MMEISSSRSCRGVLAAGLLGWAGVGSGFLSSGCSWDRFEQLRDGTPIVELERPTGVNTDFGAALAGAADGADVFVFAGGTPGASRGAVFIVGTDESPIEDALDNAHCRQDDDELCSLAQEPAGLARVLAPSGEQREFCFFSGLGRVNGVSGLAARCADNLEFAFEIPPDLVDPLVGPLEAGKPAPELHMATDRAALPMLVAAAPSEGRAWFYAPGDNRPEELTGPGEPGPGFGRSLAVARYPQGRLVAVGAPEAGQVWLYRIPDGGAVQSIGCLGNGPGSWGRTLAAGEVSGSEVEDLVVADEKKVTVLSGERLAELPDLSGQPSIDCSLGALPPNTVLASFGCGSNQEGRGCSASDFGASLAVGDFDGDGEGEVAVGAPQLVVRDQAGAGAVLIYDSQGELLDTQISSLVEPEAEFGRRLLSLPQPGRDILVVGAPGVGTTSIVYCATVTDPAVSPRCQ